MRGVEWMTPPGKEGDDLGAQEQVAVGETLTALGAPGDVELI